MLDFARGGIGALPDGKPFPAYRLVLNRQVQLVFNTTDGQKTVSDSKSLRRATLMQKVPYYTTMAGCHAVVEAIAALKAGSLEVRPLQGCFGG